MSAKIPRMVLFQGRKYREGSASHKAALLRSSEATKDTQKRKPPTAELEADLAALRQERTHYCNQYWKEKHRADRLQLLLDLASAELLNKALNEDMGLEIPF